MYCFRFFSFVLCCIALLQIALFPSPSFSISMNINTTENLYVSFPSFFHSFFADISSDFRFHMNITTDFFSIALELKTELWLFLCSMLFMNLDMKKETVRCVYVVCMPACEEKCKAKVSKFIPSKRKEEWKKLLIQRIGRKKKLFNRQLYLNPHRVSVWMPSIWQIMRFVFVPLIWFSTAAAAPKSNMVVCQLVYWRDYLSFAYSNEIFALTRIFPV